MPRLGYCGDFGIIAPSCLINQASEAFAELNETLLVALRRHKSEAGPFLEFPGLAVSLGSDSGDAIACLALSEEKIKGLVKFAQVISKQDAVALVALQKIAGHCRLHRRPPLVDLAMQLQSQRTSSSPGREG